MPNPKKPELKAEGKLNKKIGPLQLKYWIGIAAAIGLILFLYLRGKASGGTSVEGESIPLNPYQISPQQAASAGTPSPNSPPSQQLDAETLAALGIGMPTGYVTATDLQSQLDSLGSNVASQIAAATFVSPASTTTAAPAKTPPAVKTATAAPVKKSVQPKPAAIKYYTYNVGKAPKGKKSQEIKAVKGKTIKFAKNKGYYYG